MKTYSELQDLAKQFIRKVHNNCPEVGAIVMTWNMGDRKTPVAMFTHTRGNTDLETVKHLLASFSAQLEATETLDSQGMSVTPGGLLVPKKSRIIT